MAFDATKPANASALNSAEIRANWTAIQRTLGAINLAPDSSFRLWPDGDTAVPYFTTIGGAGAAIQRCGTGLADTNRKVGDFCPRVTSGAGATAIHDIQLLPSGGEFTRANFLQGLAVSGGFYVRAASAGAVRVGFFDGVGSSFSAFHPGGSVWSWLTATRVLDAGASLLVARLEVAAGTVVGYWSGPTIVFGETPPAYFQPSPTQLLAYDMKRIPQAGGNVTTGTDKERILPIAAGIVRNVQLNAKTAPASQALIVDLNNWDGSVFQTMFSTRPQIAAAANRGGAQPDSTYRWRCVKPYFGSAATASAILSADVDQVGTGTPGADLDVRVMIETMRRPLQEFLEHV